MHLLIWMGFGLAAGVLAKLVVSGNDPGGSGVSVLLGIAGAWLVGCAGRVAGFYGPDDPAGWAAATLGAMAVLAVYHVLRRR